jgi:hypothetical protein
MALAMSVAAAMQLLRELRFWFNTMRGRKCG